MADEASARSDPDRDSRDAPPACEQASHRLTKLLTEFRERGGFRSGPGALRLWSQIQEAVRQANRERLTGQD